MTIELSETSFSAAETSTKFSKKPCISKLYLGAAKSEWIKNEKYSGLGSFK